MLRVWNEETLPNSEGAAFEKEKLRRLRSKSRSTDVTIWVGKDGVSEELLEHVRMQLKARELVKLKVQRAALKEEATTQIADQVAVSTGSVLVDVMGHTFAVYKRHEMSLPRKVGKGSANER